MVDSRRARNHTASSSLEDSGVHIQTRYMREDHDSDNNYGDLGNLSKEIDSKIVFLHSLHPAELQ